jgi:hypothetical protein
MNVLFNALMEFCEITVFGWKSKLRDNPEDY